MMFIDMVILQAGISKKPKKAQWSDVQENWGV